VAVRSRLLTLLLLLLVVAVAAIMVKDLWTPDEPRYAEVAREMRVSGDYLTTRWNGQHYKEKPPLLFWAMNGFGALVGNLEPWVVRLPSLVAAAGTAIAVFAVAEEAFAPFVASWSVLILLTSLRFWLQATTGQIDMLLTACTTLSWWALWKWDRNAHGKWLALLYGGMALGALAKGPVAILVPLLTILVYYWHDKGAWLRMRLPIGAAAALAPVGIWLVTARMSAGTEAVSGMGSNLFFQTVGRMFLAQSHAHGPLYYFYNLPIDLLPWSVLLFFAIPFVWSQRNASKAMRFLLSSTVPAFLFFTAITGKRALYLLPLFPALSIVLALGLQEILDARRTGWLRALWGSWLVALLVAAAGPVALWFGEYRAVWSSATLGVSAIASVLFAWTLLRHWLGRGAIHRTIAGGTVALYVASAVFVFPTINRMKAPEDFCRPLQALTRAGVEYDIVSLQFSRPIYVYYTEHFHRYARIEMPSETCLAGFSDETQAVLRASLPDMLSEAADGLPPSPAMPTAEEKNRFIATLTARLSARGVSDADRVVEDLQRQVKEQVSLDAGDTPTFVLCEDKHWPMFTALYPGDLEAEILDVQRVGSRVVILAGNDLAARAYASVR